MYHVHGTHVTPDMNAEQAAKAKRWELPATIAALLVIPYLLLNFYADHGTQNTVVDALYFLLWGFFVLEAACMLKLAPDNWAWVKRNLLDVGIIALTAPFEFLPDGFEVLQALWLLRILDLLPVVNQRVFKITVIRFAIILWGLIIFGGGLMYAQLEPVTPDSGPQNLFDAVYWANTVVSTVGFGDLLPSTWQARLLTIFLQLSGPVLAAILVAGILPLFDKEFSDGFSDKIAEQVSKITDDIDEINEDIDDIAKGERTQDETLALILKNQEEILKNQNSATGT